ncbi:MAG: hypothetical protein QM489_03580 [Candidatus Izemoplasma sp.]
MSNRLRFLLLFLLSITSVFFAEVLSGSTKYPLYDIWGILVVIPLYGLHTILLLYIIYKFVGNQKILFSTMYFAGVLFGLYEAYLTKVLFVGLNEDSYIILGVALLEFIVLVFFWHPLISFIIPVLVFEAFMTNESNIYEGLPGKVKMLLNKKVGRLLIFIILGSYLALNADSFIEAFFSGTLTVIPILIVYYVLRRKGVHTRYGLSEILPNNKQAKVLGLLLLAMYIILGIGINVEDLTFTGQFVIGVIYLIALYTFAKKLILNRLNNEISFIGDVISFKYMIFYTMVMIFSGSAVALLWYAGLAGIFMVVYWLAWTATGLFLVIHFYKK